MEATKNQLLTSTAPAPNISAKSKKAGTTKEAKKAKVAIPKLRSARANKPQHDHHRRHGDRGGDGDDGEAGEGDGPPLPRPRGEQRGRKLQTKHLCERYQNSDRTIDRWVRDPHLNFPRPMVINGRRYWEADEIDAFDQRQKAATVGLGEETAP